MIVEATVRQLQIELEHSKRLTVDKYQRELSSSVEGFGLMFKDQVSKWEEESRLLHKQRARDRSDLVFGVCLTSIGNDQ